MLKINSFFTGIGGFDLGFEKLGFKVAFQCEINNFCNQVLRNHWPKVKRATDIRNIDPNSIPEADIWCAGFPCQDVSVARGSMGRDGLNGKNSGLFYDFLNLIEKKKPRVLLIENVTGLLNSHGGNDFKIVIQSLTTLGYGISWRVFNTRYFGAPQSRPRVYICAWLDNVDKAVETLHEYEASVKDRSPKDAFKTVCKSANKTLYVPKISYCLAATSGRHTGTDWSRTYVSYDKAVRRLTPSECEKLQGFPVSWTVPNDESVKATEWDTLRYHAIGNAVSVPVIAWIAHRIKKIYSAQNQISGLQNILKRFADFNTDKIRTQFFTTLNSQTLFYIDAKQKIKWRTGGLAIGDEVIDANINNCPTCPFDSNLLDVIETGEIDERYFLSPGAAVGILRRVDSQNRNLFEPLKQALESLAKTQKTKQNL